MTKRGERMAMVRAALCLLATGIGAPALASTPAGTGILNIVEARAGDERSSKATAENRIVVAERLDVALTYAGDGAVMPGSAAAVTLTNRGNGSEAFVLAATTDDGRAAMLVDDRDGDGRYDPSVDRPLDGGRVGPVAPEATLTVLMIAPGDAAGRRLVVRAVAATGSGDPGTAWLGQGDAGSDAVDGPTGGAATLEVPIAGADARPTLVKRQSVAAPDGSAKAVAGAVITYELEARFAGAASAARIDDPVPEGTSYLPGSLSLDGVPLSDADDADPGRADDRAIAVRLGPIPQAASHAVRFKVTIR